MRMEKPARRNSSYQTADGYPSFVDSTKPGRRCWWKVKPTGDYQKDCYAGEQLGLEYLAYEEADRGGPGHLQLIVMDMPRKLTGVEIGFLIMVSYAAGTGANGARSVSKYWDKCAAANPKLSPWRLGRNAA